MAVNDRLDMRSERLELDFSRLDRRSYFTADRIAATFCWGLLLIIAIALSLAFVSFSTRSSDPEPRSPQSELVNIRG